MPDDTTTPTSLDARRAADVRRIAAELVKLGMNPPDAKAQAEAQSDRLSYAGKGPVRVLKPFCLGDFYEGSFEDPLGPLISEIFHGAPDEQKLVATKLRDEQIAEMAEEKIRDSRNWVL